ncbi:MAG: prepilin-type N-terminal cleavage/methylation domain-containing protein [Deinococcales bacterium]
MNRPSAGLTLVELLVAAALMVVVLGIVGIFFARQAGITKTTQAQTSIQDTARAVMQLVTNDLLLAGANQYYPSAASTVSSVTLTGAIPTGTDGGLTDDVSLEYVTSLRPTLAGACRHVEYRMSGSTLERSDVACGTAANFSVLATHVLAFDLLYKCSDDSTAATPADCPANTYLRSVRAGLMVRSPHKTPGSPPSPSYTAPTADHGGSGSSSVTCPSGYSCVVLTQTVQTPSLKQYAPGG